MQGFFTMQNIIISTVPIATTSTTAEAAATDAAVMTVEELVGSELAGLEVLVAIVVFPVHGGIGHEVLPCSGDFAITKCYSSIRATMWKGT